MKNILITGGAGFLGSHLCDRLVKTNNNIICLDNFLTSSEENIKKLKSYDNFKFIEHDITVPLDLKVDQIYNLACPASPIHYQNNPVKTIKTCVYGTINLLDLAIKNKSQILQASTSEVYGDPEISPQHESYLGKVNPIGVRSCYDEGKRCAETLFFDYHRQYKLPIKVVRIFNTYGPKMALNDGRVISNLIIQALKNEDLTIFGNGEQTRSFCYVDDLIEVIIRMMNSDPSIKGPLNIGNPKEFRIIDLAKLILKITNSNSQINFIDLPSDDPKQRKPDIQKVKKTLNWEPETSLEDGLVKTINYFKKII